MNRPLFLPVLLGVVGLLHAWIGLSTTGGDRVLGLAGGVVLVAAALWWAVHAGGAGLRTRLAVVALVVLGTVPLAAVTWWSIVTPLLAMTALWLSLPILRPAVKA